MGLALSVFFGLVPMFLFACMVYWLDRYEKEPILLLGGVFTWGAIVAAGAAFVINTLLGIGFLLFTQSESAAELASGSLIAPIVEESLKGFAVLAVFLLFRQEFDSILDGLLYAAIAALGFAATENIYYIYTYGYLEGDLSGLFSLVFIRVILVGWQHPFYTAFIGIALAATRLTRSTLVKFIALPLGWFAAVSTHAIHNTLASLLSGMAGRAIGTFIDWSGWLVMFIFALYMLDRERKMVVRFLGDEVKLGTINERQYHTACSAWSQTAARIGALFNQRYTPTDRFYRLCGELAHKRSQLTNMGEEDGNSSRIQILQAELKKLSPQADT